MVERSFFDRRVTPQDFLTQYELKRVIMEMISLSGPLTATLGLSSTIRDSYSSYQRNRMTPIALLQRGLVTPSVAKYRAHYEMTRYRAALEPVRMATMHERAMSMVS